MKTLSTCLILLVAVIASACTANPMPGSPSLPTASMAAEPVVLRFGQLGSASVKDVPWLVALDSLRAQGYTVELTEFAKSDLMTAAVAQGEIDIASITASRVWAAAAKGADLCTVVATYHTTFLLVVKKGIEACGDLKEQALAFSSMQSAGYILLEQYLKDQCPGVNPEIVLISQSQNRLAALQADEVDGAHLELADWLRLDSQMPGMYHVLIDYGNDYPNLLTSGFSVRCAWAEQESDAVRDFVQALVLAQRELTADPIRLQEEMVRRMDVDASEAQTTAKAYLEQGAWDLNGGITPEGIQYTLDLLVDTGTLPPDLEPDDVADLSYLNEVLDEIGRE